MAPAQEEGGQGPAWHPPPAGARPPALFALTPITCLGHLTGLIPPSGEQGLVLLELLLLTVFAARKYSQPVEADLGCVHAAWGGCCMLHV